MAAILELEWDSRDLAVWRDRRVELALTRALARAGDEALRAMKAAAGRAVRDKKRMRVAKVNKALPVVYPSSRKSMTSLLWRMNVSGEPVPVASFPHRQTSKGVSVAINKGSRKLIRSAFIATTRSGHTGVFKRKGDKRLPIAEAFTTRVSDVFADSGMVPAVQERTQSVFARAFARLLPLELGKLR